jgi:hypothetical protein
VFHVEPAYWADYNLDPKLLLGLPSRLRVRPGSDSILRTWCVPGEVARASGPFQWLDCQSQPAAVIKLWACAPRSRSALSALITLSDVAVALLLRCRPGRAERSRGDGPSTSPYGGCRWTTLGPGSKRCVADHGLPLARIPRRKPTKAGSLCLSRVLSFHSYV